MRATSEPIDRFGARRSGFPSGVLHEGRGRADRSLGGSTHEIPPRCKSQGNQPSPQRLGIRKQLWAISRSTGISPLNLVNFKAKRRSTTLRQEKRVTDSLTLHSIDKSIKYRVGGYT